MSQNWPSGWPASWPWSEMMNPGTSKWIAFPLLLALGAGCTLDAGSRGPFGPEDPETAIPKKPLPPQPPTRHALAFTADETPGRHLKPKMAGTVADTTLKRSPNPSAMLTTAETAALRKAAEADPRVAGLLGNRWGFVEAQRVPPEGKVAFGCCRDEARFARLTYFSYSQNVAVEVLLKEQLVMEAVRREGYVPPEGPQDVERGIALARADSRLAGRVESLQGHGLLMQPDIGFFRNDPGYGHRTIWITFSQGQDGDPKFWAVVDLTDDRVLEAGQEPSR